MDEGDAKPLATVTYEDTLDDIVEVAILNSGYRRPNLLRTARLLVWVTLPAAYFGYRWWQRGYVEVVEVLAIFWLAYVVAVAWNFVSYRRRFRAIVAKQLAEKKNIGLAVPVTVSLHDRHFVSGSVLEQQCACWDVVEAVNHEAGYLMLVKGAMIIYVPDRAFATEEEAKVFRETAQRLFEASRQQQARLDIAPPWA